MTQSAKLKLELLQNAAANQTLANTTFVIVDQVAQCVVKDKDLATPPGSPSNGDAYIVAGSPTGAWSGKAGQIAYWLSDAGIWQFIVPFLGFRAGIADELDADGLPKIYGYTGSAWAAISAGGSSGSAAIVVVSGTSKTFGLSDAETYQRCTNGSAVTLTLPPQSSVSWDANTEIHVRQAGAGQVTIAAGSGVTINAPFGGTLNLAGTGATVTLKRVASDTWDLMGQVAG